MRRLAVAFCVSLAVFATVVLAVDGARLPAPPPGEVLATTLADGSPVFVVRHGPDAVSVLSAVSTRANHVVAWCPAERMFVEPGGASTFDPWGRWMTGPAPTGLASYDATLTGDASAVRVGRLGDPPPRWRVPRVPDTRVPRDCANWEGARGGVFPPGTDPATALRPDELRDVPFGASAVIDGLVDFSGEEPVLCAPPRSGRCPEGSWRVARFFWDGLRAEGLGTYLASIQGPLLVRRAGVRAVTDVAVLNRLESIEPYRYTVAWTERANGAVSSEWAGLVESVDVTRDAVVLRAVDRFVVVDGPEVAPWQAVTLERRTGTVYDGRGIALDRWPYLAPAELAGLVADAAEPVPVRFFAAPGGAARSVYLLADDERRMYGLD